MRAFAMLLRSRHALWGLPKSPQGGPNSQGVTGRVTRNSTDERGLRPQAAGRGQKPKSSVALEFPLRGFCLRSASVRFY